IWAVINDIPIPDPLPPAAEAVLRGLTWRRSAGRNPPEHWFTTLRDAPRPQPIDPCSRAAVAAARQETAA
ncbi:MAG: acetoin utilization protein AcuC, partial [Pseudomonadota bacterium]